VHNNKKKSWFFKLSVLHLLLAAAAATWVNTSQPARRPHLPLKIKKKNRPLYKASLRNLVLAYTRAFKS